MTLDLASIGGMEDPLSAPDVLDLTVDTDESMAPPARLWIVGDVAVEPVEMLMPTPACRYRSWRLVAKWMFDRVLGIVAVILALPLLILIAVVVRLTSPGPALFTQERVGLGGRPFMIYKFRTMRKDAEAYLGADAELSARHRQNDFKLPVGDDIRVTTVGRLLRRLSLDELPQLINIVKGDMSFVGPRPVVPDELAEYGPYRLMYEAVYPGLTGAWQVGGRAAIRYPARARIDAEYVETWSFWGDMAIMLRTVPALLDEQRTA